MEETKKTQERANPFAKGGLARSPPRKTVGSGVSDTCGSATASEAGGTKLGVAMDGPGLIRAMDRMRETLPKVMEVSEQLDAIIDFTSSRNNIAKDLKLSLLRLRMTVQAACKEREELEAKLQAEQGAKELERLAATERARDFRKPRNTRSMAGRFRLRGRLHPVYHGGKDLQTG